MSQPRPFLMASACLLGITILAFALSVVGFRRSSTELTEQAREAAFVRPIRSTKVARLAVSVTVDPTEDRPAVAPDWNGIVTSVGARLGGELAGGDDVLTIDGVGRIALGGPVPAYRDLTFGDSGSDVGAYQHALARRGLLVESAISNQFDSPTARATGRLLAQLGAPPSPPVFPRSLGLWLPHEPFTVGTVLARVGQPAPAVGSAVLEGVPGANSLNVALPDGIDLSSGGTPTAATLTVKGVNVRLDAATLKVLPEDAGLLATIGAEKTESSDGTTPGTLEVAFAAALLNVPSSAVVTDARGRQCVVVSDSGHLARRTVKVATSSVGVAGISFGLAARDQVVANPLQIRSSPCG